MREWDEEISQWLARMKSAPAREAEIIVMAALTLALGIGATTSIFSVVYATLYEPMPYPKPDHSLAD